MKKAIVIGSGFGGLAVAIRLQARGFQVTIFEKNERVGGQASQFKAKGYTFDMGPSLITAPEIIDSVFRSANRRLSDYLSLQGLDPFYRIYFADGSHLDYSGDEDRMIEQMQRFNPADASQYPAFMRYARQLYEIVIKGGLGSTPFDYSTLLKFLPDALKLRALQSTYGVVSKYFSDARNRFAFSFHPLFIGGSPFRSPAVYLMIPYLEKAEGVWYTEGGMYSLVQAFEKLFIELGGVIRTNAEVQEIVVSNGRADGVVANGECFAADVVISNAHFAHTYRDLIEPDHRRKWSGRKIERMAYSMSCFLMFLGVRKQYPQLFHHTLILSERYKSLVSDIFDRKVLPNDLSMYLHVPSRTDPSMAPEGCDSIFVLAPTPNLLGKTDWDEMAPAFAGKILSLLEDFGLKDIRDHIEVMRLFTPKDFSRERNNYLGSAWGLEPRLTQTASFRPRNRSEDVERLYLVGASTHPGAGIPGVLLSAEATEKAILQDVDAPKRILQDDFQANGRWML